MVGWGDRRGADSGSSERRRRWPCSGGCPAWESDGGWAGKLQGPRASGFGGLVGVGAGSSGGLAWRGGHGHDGRRRRYGAGRLGRRTGTGCVRRRWRGGLWTVREAARGVRWQKPGGPTAMARTWSAREQREEEKIAVSKQQRQKKEGAARRQRGTRGTRASFGGAVANLALVTQQNIGTLH